MFGYYTSTYFSPMYKLNEWKKESIMIRLGMQKNLHSQISVNKIWD